eukprot:16138011-Heterocapsa_arctica.AAC.1
MFFTSALSTVPPVAGANLGPLWPSLGLVEFDLLSSPPGRGSRAVPHVQARGDVHLEDGSVLVQTSFLLRIIRGQRREQHKDLVVVVAGQAAVAILLSGA